MTAYHDLQYIKLVKDVLRNGASKSDRTGVGTKSVFGRQMRFDLSDGTIPLLTTKKMHIPSIIHEILWYLQGTGNVQYLRDNGVRIWDAWADENGNLGPVYGVMWRKWPDLVWNSQANAHETVHIDQIATLVHKLKINPLDRRLIVSAWNPALLPDSAVSFSENVADGKQALPPCHYVFQCHAQELPLATRVLEASKSYCVEDIFEAQPTTIESILDSHNIPKYRLSLMLNMRSNDVGLGNPFNIAQYSILLRMLCEVTNMVPGEFVWVGGDTHIYTNHVEALTEQLTRVPKPSPTLTFARKINDIDDFKFSDFIISNYEHSPAIKMQVAV